MSRVIDWSDRRTCVLFGDGSGAVILQASTEPGILSSRLGANGAFGDILLLKQGADRHLQMQGNKVFRLAVDMLDKVSVDILRDNQLTCADIDWIIPHQANLRIITHLAEKLGISMSQVIVTVDKHANTSSASIPLALDLAVRDGKIARGQHMLLEAVGGGFTWGAALVKF